MYVSGVFKAPYRTKTSLLFDKQQKKCPGLSLWFFWTENVKVLI